MLTWKTCCFIILNVKLTNSFLRSSSLFFFLRCLPHLVLILHAIRCVSYVPSGNQQRHVIRYIIRMWNLIIEQSFSPPTTFSFIIGLFSRLFFLLLSIHFIKHLCAKHMISRSKMFGKFRRRILKQLQHLVSTEKIGMTNRWNNTHSKHTFTKKSGTRNEL